MSIFNDMWTTICLIETKRSNQRKWFDSSISIDHHSFIIHFNNKPYSRYFAAAAINEITDNKIDKTAITRNIFIYLFCARIKLKSNRTKIITIYTKNLRTQKKNHNVSD